MDTKYNSLQRGTTYRLPDGKSTVTFGTDEAQGLAPSTDTKGTGVVALPVTTGDADRAWIKFCKTLGAGMGTGLSWSFRPLMTRIATETLLAGGVPPRLATAMGLMLSELVINPVVIGTGTTTAELISNRIQRLFTGGNVIGGKSPDYAKDLGDAIGVGFTTMAFALAYEGAGKPPAQTSWETYAPALLGGALTGAMAALTAMMGKEIRQLDAMMQEKELTGKHDLVMETPPELAFPKPLDNKQADPDLEQGSLLPQSGGGPAKRASCGQRLSTRLAMSNSDKVALKGFFNDRVRAAFETNREMVLNFVPVVQAQILLAYTLPMINPAKENILGLTDREHMTKETQYQLVSALATALVHNKRVEGWTNFLTGTPTAKQSLKPTEFNKLAKQIVPAMVNGAITLVSSYIASVVSSPDKMSDAIKEQFAGWSDLGDGSTQQVLQLAGGMLGGMLLLRVVAGSGEGLRMGEMVTSGATGLMAGFTGQAPVQLGAVVGSVSHALIQPTHDKLNKEFSNDGALGYTKQVARPLRSVVQGAFHAITNAHSLVPAFTGGSFGGALLGGTTAASLTAAGIVVMPGGIPIAAIVGIGASLTGGFLGVLATGCRQVLTARSHPPAAGKATQLDTSVQMYQRTDTKDGLNFMTPPKGGDSDSDSDKTEAGELQTNFHGTPPNPTSASASASESTTTTTISNSI